MKNITVNPETYRKFLRARAGANAATKRANQLKESLSLPDAERKTVGEYILQDGNGQAIGKMTIAPRDGYEVKSGYTARIS